MVNELDLDAGFPFQWGVPFGFLTWSPILVLALDFLQEFKIFLRLIASIESFFKTLGFCVSASALESAALLGSELPFLRPDFPLDFGELGGDTLL
jgi:hypothetical protein